MSATNLLRTEAQARAQLISEVSYRVYLDLSAAKTAATAFRSVTVVNFTATQAGATFIDLRAEQLRQVVLDGQDITPAEFVEEQGIALQLTAGAHELVVDADCAYSFTGQGLHRFRDPSDGETYLYSQCETADAKRIVACFDQPDLKATWQFVIDAPTGWKVISNPELTAATTPVSAADGSELAVPAGATRHYGEVNYPLSTYLLAVCAGPYFEVRDSWSGKVTVHPETASFEQPLELTVPFGIYCRQSLAHALDAERIFTETKQGFDFYHEHFGIAYPFHKYDQVFCPEYNMGAMENAGCVTFRDEYVFVNQETRQMYERRCDTILHELAHMWFGDLVTMKWWDDLWLNESFATWAAAISQAEATEYTGAWVTFNTVEKGWAYSQDALPTTHPISADASDIETVEQNFDGITYAKGASVLKQLQAYVGRDAFFAGVRAHFAANAFGNATFADLLKALASASGRDLSNWADQWLKTTGMNTLTASFTTQNGVYSKVQIHQSGAQPGAGELRDHRIRVGLYHLDPASGQVVRTRQVELDVTGAVTEIPELTGAPVADLLLVNDDDLTYALVELDAASQAFVQEHIAQLADPMARSLVISSLWEATRAGKFAARDFLAVCEKALVVEDSVASLERILGFVNVAVRQYASRDWVAEQGAHRLAQLLVAGIERGGELALSFYKAAQGVVPNEELQEIHRRVLAGTNPAFAADAQQRWNALTALIAAGEFGSDPAACQAEIDRLHATDQTGSGQNNAWRARAAIPNQQHKLQLFQEIVAGGEKMSNLQLRHTGAGLLYPTDPDVLGPVYAEAFLQAVPQLWEKLESEVALRTLVEYFPAWEITAQAVAATQAVAAAATSQGLKRIMTENADRLARALRNQQVDAQSA